MKTRVDELSEEIRPITMPGVHSRFLKFFTERAEPRGKAIYIHSQHPFHEIQVPFSFSGLPLCVQTP